MRKPSSFQKSFLPLALVLAILLTAALPAMGAETVSDAASTIQLMKTEGSVSVTNGSGRALSVFEDMRLYNGYHAKTAEKSYAWASLDSSKLIKLDEVSEAEVRKAGKKLEVLLNSGNLYFNVSEPLEKEESLNIRTSTIIVGIRGTCGWVKMLDAWRAQVYLLEGQVECSVTDPATGESRTTVLRGGEMAEFVVYPQGQAGARCEIIRQSYTEEQIDGFVLVELVKDRALCEKIYTGSGLDVLAPIDPMRLRDMYTYSKVLIYNPNGELNQEVEYFPDEQGRIGTTVTHYIAGSGDDVTRYIYNDAGTLQAMSFENGAYTVTEDTADHRTIEWVRDFDGVLMKYICYYDEQGRETRREHVSSSNEVRFYWTYTYDAAGKLIRGEAYTASGALSSYCLYEYD